MTSKSEDGILAFLAMLFGFAVLLAIFSLGTLVPNKTSPCEETCASSRVRACSRGVAVCQTPEGLVAKEVKGPAIQ